MTVADFRLTASGDGAAVAVAAARVSPPHVNAPLVAAPLSAAALVAAPPGVAHLLGVAPSIVALS